MDKLYFNSAQDFVITLENNQILENSEINFNPRSLSREDIKTIAQALQSGKCPQGTLINLSLSRIYNTGIRLLARALRSGMCPQRLGINLGINELDFMCVQPIIEALQSGECPSGLMIDLTSNKLGVRGAQAIATALQSGKCPQGLQLILNANNISEGTELIAGALQSGKCPQGLGIHLKNNNLEDDDANALAYVLKSRRCPQDLQLGLADNNISTAGGHAFAQTILSGKCLPSLKLTGIDNLETRVKLSLNTLLKTIHNNTLYEAQSRSRIFNAIRGVFCFNPSLVFTDKELTKKINAILESYLKSLQASIKGLKEENYYECYSLLLQEITDLILVMREATQTVQSEQTQWINDLWLKIPEKMTPDPMSSSIFKQLNAKIKQLEQIDEAHLYLKDTLITLRQQCAMAVLDKLNSRNNLEMVLAKSSIKTIIDETCSFLDNFLWPSNNRSQKMYYIKEYENKMYPFKPLKTIGKCLGVIVIAALCAATGAAIGAGIGLLAGAWSGPGALVSAFTGMLTGGFTAWNVGITVGAVLAGVTGGAIASYAFFKPVPATGLGKAVDCVIDASQTCAAQTKEDIDPFSFITMAVN